MDDQDEWWAVQERANDLAYDNEPIITIPRIDPNMVAEQTGLDGDELDEAVKIVESMLFDYVEDVVRCSAKSGNKSFVVEPVHYMSETAGGDGELGPSASDAYEEWMEMGLSEAIEMAADDARKA